MLGAATKAEMKKQGLWGDATNTWICNTEHNAVSTVGNVRIVRLQKFQVEGDDNFKTTCLKKTIVKAYHSDTE